MSILERSTGRYEVSSCTGSRAASTTPDDQGGAVKTVFGGYVFDSNWNRHQLDVVENPSDEVIERYVAQVAREDGVLGLRLSPEPEFGPYNLVMYAEKGRFLLMLSDYLEDGDHGVRTIVHGGIGDGLSLMLGEMYPTHAMTRDVGIARLAFQEFRRNGDVPNTMMK